MVVSVKFFGLQRKLARTDQIQIPLVKETRVTDVASYISARYPELRLAEEGLLVTVNNRISAPNRILKANDRVSFIPHIGGG
jgi:molybdopterin converting factor small subunit